MRIRAAVLGSHGPALEVGEVDLAAPANGEVLVKLEAAGVCRTDLNVVDGLADSPKPVILGHEGAGTIAAVGPGTSLEVGTRVALTWLDDCGRCESCLRGLSHMCSEAWAHAAAGTLSDGTSRLSREGETVAHYSLLSTFADYAVVSAACCIPLPDQVPFAVGALIGCAVITGVGAVWNTAAVRPGDRVAVFGCGGVGIAAIMGAGAVAASPIVAVDTLPAKLETALSLGATDTVLSQRDPVAVAEDVRRASGGGVDYAFVAVGHPDVMASALQSTRPGGAAVLIGIAPTDATLSLSPAIFRTERRLLGSVYGSSRPKRDFPRLFDSYLRGHLQLDDLISHELPLDRINEGLEFVRSGTARRVIISERGERR